MFEKQIQFIIKDSGNATIEEILKAIDTIKKAHPNAKISVYVKM